MINIDANVATRSDNSEILNFLIGICLFLVVSIKTSIYVFNDMKFALLLDFHEIIIMSCYTILLYYIQYTIVVKFSLISYC